jgi:drug/metabolite transporter (DMT)-like permease
LSQPTTILSSDEFWNSIMTHSYTQAASNKADISNNVWHQQFAGALNEHLTSSMRGAIWGGVAVSIWGVYLAVARANVSGGILPADVAFVRYAVAGLLMLPWLLRHSPSTMAGLGWGKALVLTALAGPLFILVSASGFQFAPLAHGAVVQPAAITVAGLALGAVLLRDQLTQTRVIGAGVILAGLAFIAGPSALVGGLSSLAGDSLFASAGVMWALFSVLSRRWSISPIAATAAVSVLSGAIYLPIYLFTNGVSNLAALPTHAMAQLIIVHGILSGVVAVYAFGRAVEMLGAARAAAFPALVPVVATLVGIPLTGEIPSFLQIGGLIVVTLGLAITQRSPKPDSTKTSSKPQSKAKVRAYGNF